jgi:hypothetical protein
MYDRWHPRRPTHASEAPAPPTARTTGLRPGPRAGHPPHEPPPERRPSRSRASPPIRRQVNPALVRASRARRGHSYTHVPRLLRSTNTSPTYGHWRTRDQRALQRPLRRHSPYDRGCTPGLAPVTRRGATDARLERVRHRAPRTRWRAHRGPGSAAHPPRPVPSGAPAVARGGPRYGRPSAACLAADVDGDGIRPARMTANDGPVYDRWHPRGTARLRRHQRCPQPLRRALPPRPLAVHPLRPSAPARERARDRPPQWRDANRAAQPAPGRYDRRTVPGSLARGSGALAGTTNQSSAIVWPLGRPGDTARGRQLQPRARVLRRPSASNDGLTYGLWAHRRHTRRRGQAASPAANAGPHWVRHQPPLARWPLRAPCGAARTGTND